MKLKASQKRWISTGVVTNVLYKFTRRSKASRAHAAAGGIDRGLTLTGG
jgi:hypothetical protein